MLMIGTLQRRPRGSKGGSFRRPDSLGTGDAKAAVETRRIEHTKGIKVNMTVYKNLRTMTS